MNNIYKVIWSKAKNCYVVASEIARSHTKSASGSEKIGGGTRRKLLASLMALSLLCGGLGVAEASVHVVESGETYEVLTTQEVKAGYGTKDDVENNKNNIKDLQNTTRTQGQNIATNAANIANNKDDIAKKIDTETANATFATKEELRNLKDTVNGKADESTVTTALADKADKADVDTKLAGKANKATTLAGYEINDAYTKDATDTAITTKVNEEKKDRELKDAELSGRIDTLSTTVDSKVSKTDLNTNYYTKAETNAAIKTAVDDEKNARENAINGEVTERNKAIADAIAREETNRDAAITNAKTDLKEKVTAEETNRKEEDAKLEGKITENTNAINNEKTAREAADTDLSKRIGTVTEDGKYIKKSGTNNVSENLKVLDTQAKTNADNIQTNADNIKNNKDEIARVNGELVKTNDYFNAELGKTNDYFNKELSKTNNHFNTELGKTNAALQATNKRTAGIDRIDATSETTIEKNVTVDNKGNVTAKGKLKGEVVDAGAVNAGSLSVENASTLKGDVTMDKKLSVTGETSLGKTDVGGALTVTGKSDLKGDVTLGTPNGSNTVAVNGTANFNAAVNMANGLNVTNGETNLKKTTVDGNLKVTGTITTDKMVFGDKVNSNYTEIDHGKVTSKNHVVNAAGEAISSSSTFDVEKNEVGFANSITGEQSSHKQTSDVIKDTVKNNTTGDQSFHKQTSDVIMDNVKDGKNSNNRTQTKTETKDIITDENGNSSTTSQTASENKTYLKDKDGNTNSTIDTAKGYDKTIKGENGETSTKQTATDITNTAQNGTIKNEAMNITNEAKTQLTDKVGTNTRVTTSTSITDTVGTANRKIENGKIIDTAGDFTVTTENGKGTTFAKTGGSAAYSTKAGAPTDTNIAGNHISTGRVDANELGVSDKDGTNTADLSVKAGEGVKASAGNGTTTGSLDVTAGEVGSSVKDASGNGSTFKQRIDAIMGKVKNNTTGEESSHKQTSDVIKDTVKNNTTGDQSFHKQTSDVIMDNVKDGKNSNNRTQTKTETKDIITDENGNSSTTSQTASENKTYLKDKDGNTNSTIDTAKGYDKTIKGENGETSTKQDATDITHTAKDGTITNDAKNIVNNASENITNTAKNITNEATETLTNNAKDIVTNASNSITEKVGETNVTTKTTTSSKSEIQNADTITSVQQTDSMVQSFVGKKDFSVTNVTTNSADASANAVTKDGQTSTVLNNKDGLLIRNTANGKSFTMYDGTNTGTALEWTNVKGNEISTGKVEANYAKMNYADVMKDLGVHGNAKIAGKTTTGSLEVTGTSTLKGDVTMENNATVGNNLTVNGTTKTKTLNVTENAEVGGELKVAKKATFEDSVSIAKDLTVGGDVTAKSYKVDGKTYISADGINANDQKITNVADGSISEGSKDAVNGGQLYQVKNDLEGKVNKVGANAAAMANLHPMEFDPDSKWNIAAAMGNYGSETATAIGAFYRPNEDVMVNLSTAFGTGENMVGGGVSVRLGKGSNKLSREESNALKAQVNDLTARMDALLSVLNPNMSKDFPDVPENHWAYEAVSRLAGNDIVQGYPDGEFHGDRTMTRYEMAEIIYNALSRGAEAERELVEEFKPELQAMAASEKATAEKAEG